MLLQETSFKCSKNDSASERQLCHYRCMNQGRKSRNILMNVAFFSLLIVWFFWTPKNWFVNLALISIVCWACIRYFGEKRS
jgi:uncharacterized membrane protein